MDINQLYRGLLDPEFDMGETMLLASQIFDIFDRAINKVQVNREDICKIFDASMAKPYDTQNISQGAKTGVIIDIIRMINVVRVRIISNDRGLKSEIYLTFYPTTATCNLILNTTRRLTGHRRVVMYDEACYYVEDKTLIKNLIDLLKDHPNTNNESWLFRT